METRYNLDGAPKIKVHAILIKIHSRNRLDDGRCIWNLLRCDTGRMGTVHDTSIALEYKG